MSTQELPTRSRPEYDAPSGLWTTVKYILQPLSSLKLTVVLLAMSAFIVLAGTLAQVNADVWEAVRMYFRIDMGELMQSRSIGDVLRNLFVRIDCQIFAPPAFFPSQPNLKPWVAFWFPRGWTIGAVMLANLFSAHLVRFKMQAKGSSLIAGIGVILLGAALTWAVIVTSATADGVQTDTLVAYDRVWQLMGLSILAISGCLVFVGLSDGNKPVERALYLVSAILAGAVSAGVLLVPPLEDPSMRILYQLLKGTICGVVLLSGCWLVFRKRAGIVLLHSGIGMLMVYEILVGLNAGTMEASMSIEEGDTAVYTTDIRSTELVVADLNDAQEDIETIIPGTRLKTGEKYEDEKLPFIVELLTYYPNSTLYNKAGKFNLSRPGQPAEEPKEADLSTIGRGKTFRITPLDPSVGTDTNQRADTPSGYVRLLDRESGQEIGTYLATTVLSAFGMPGSEPLLYNGKKYELELRFRRTYTPFHVKLHDVQQNNYVATNTPRDYRSIITLVDHSREKPVTIDEFHVWMNNPLRYGGYTFYQSGVGPADETGRQSTTLQVVENEGWTIPYLACMITAVGMLFQFVLVLTRFLGKVSRPALNQTGANDIPVDRFWPTVAAGGALVLFLCCLYPAAKTPKAPEGFDFASFGKIPIFYEGRPQPIDSLARNSLLSMNDRETYTEDKQTYPAIRWFLDVITDSPDAEKHPVFQIENLDLQKALGLERRERFRYAYAEFKDKLESMNEEIGQLSETKTENLNLYQRKLVQLARKSVSVRKLQFSFAQIPGNLLPEIPTPEELEKNPRLAIEWMDETQALLDRLEGAVRERGAPIVVPVHMGPEAKSFGKLVKREWVTFPTGSALAALDARRSESDTTPEGLWREMFAAYRAGNAKDFNRHVSAYLAILDQSTAEQRAVDGADVELNTTATSFEHYFNRVGPFNLASFMYVGAFVLVALGWVLSGFGGMRALHTGAFVFALLTFGLHAAAIVGRIYISGRPPVTNLFSAAVFIGCAAAAFSLVMELFFKKGIGTTLACVVGFLSLRVAGGLSTDGDTLAVLQAVLDTQFWLATHVVTITLGYATTYVCGFIGVIYILGGLLTPAFSDKDRQKLTAMMYGTLCFAIFFSFVGTVLGGLWADDSWGRFWGWDPKENGALIIVIWNAMILHARWGGMIKERGLAALCVLGNIVVSWSFFGVNELGVGLHAYGLTEGRMKMLSLFAVSQLVIAGLALIPKSAWWSVRANADDPNRVPLQIDPMA